MARIIDNLIALRIVYLLTVPIEKTDAFKLGLIDASGSTIKQAETSEEKNATSMLHRLVWNIKKVFALIPGGKTRLGSLAAAYLLIREQYEMKLSEADSLQYFNENFDRVWGLPFEEREIIEDAFEYLLAEDAAANATGAGVAGHDAPLGSVARRKKFAEFSIDDDTFTKFASGSQKYKRWSSYLNMEDTSHKQIYDFAKANPSGVIVLKDSKGNMKGVKFSRRSNGDWANVKRKPKQLGESIHTIFDSIDIEDIIL